MSFQRVIDILDQSIGGPGAGIGGPHRAFWRRLTLAEFITKEILGVPLVAPRDGAASGLVRALKGEAPFGFDLLPEPPEDAIFRRMPAGREPVPAGPIAFIEQWINDGCPLEAASPSTAVRKASL